MTDLLELEDMQQEDFEEEKEMGSINHSLTQARLTGLLISDERYTVAIELSLDVSSPERPEILKKYDVKAEKELIPDICLFNVGEIDYLEPDEGDVLRTEKRVCWTGGFSRKSPGRDIHKTTRE